MYSLRQSLSNTTSDAPISVRDRLGPGLRESTPISLREHFGRAGRLPRFRAGVRSGSGPDWSSPARDIVAQAYAIDFDQSQVRFQMHGYDSGGPAPHYQGVGLLRDVAIGGQRYRRAVLSVNHDEGLMVSSERVTDDVPIGSADLTFLDHEARLDLRQTSRIRLDPSIVGKHLHPGGIQATGDLVAIAMEKPDAGETRAGVYFVRVDGLEPAFLSYFLLGDGGAPDGLVTNAAASCGLLKLEEGFLVAVSGAKNGTAGIWFYATTATEITSDTSWEFVDFWTPPVLCNIDDGKHGTGCYVGAGGGASLIADSDGRIYLIVTTGTSGGGYDDEFAQLYRVDFRDRDVDDDWPGMKVDMTCRWSDKKKLGQLATRHFSMRWLGAAQTTDEGGLMLLNGEKGRRRTRPRDRTDGTIRVSP